MLFPEYKWVEFANGGIQNRGYIVDTSKIDSLLAKTGPSECYRSFYRYTTAFAEYVKKNNSVAGWHGEAYTDYIWIDIDDPIDLTKSLDRARVLLGQLQTEYGINDDIPIFFSGSKGFHLGVDARYFMFSPSAGLPKICRQLAILIAKDLSIDTAIYDPTRLFRLNNTINGKSGLYKVALTEAELNTKNIDEIKHLALTPRDIQFNTKDVSDGLLVGLMEGLKEATLSQPLKKQSEGRINKLRLNGTKLCLWRIQQGVGEGLRDDAGIRLASDYAKKGMPAEITHELMKAWNRFNTPPLSDQEITAKVASAYGSQVYDFGCNDPILQQFCHEDCFLFDKPDKQDDIIPVYQMSQLSDIYKEYVKNIATKKILYPCLPKITHFMRGHRPGEVTVILARPQIGKSLLGQTLIHYVANIQHVPCIMFSLEMPKELVFERGVSMELEISTDEVEKAYYHDKEADIKAHVDTINNIYYIDKCNLSLNDIQSTIERIGGIGLIVIDYMSLVAGIGRTDYERTSYVARKVKNLAKDTNTSIIMLSQVSRKDGDETTPIRIDDGRDSGAIEEGCDFLIGMWRNPDNAKQITCRLNKSRRGGVGATENMMLLGNSVKFVSTEDWGLEDEDV